MSADQSWWRGANEAEQPPSEKPSLESHPMDVPGDGPEEKLLTRRIHILGSGSIGTFISHALKCLPNPPPITLMMHRQAMYVDFQRAARLVRLVNKETEVVDERGGYDVDLIEQHRETGETYWRYIPDRPKLGGPATEPRVREEVMDSNETYIYSLIVAVKGPQTKRALLSIKHRLNADSTICLIQNGMGQVDELNQEVFTDPETRPTYTLGIISHGVHLAGFLNAVHAGFGTTALGIVRDTDKFPFPPKNIVPSAADLSDEDRKRMFPTDKDLYANLSSRYLLRTLTRSTILTCAAFPYLDLMQLQLEKLSTNALLSPITSLLNIPNGEVLGNGALSKVRRLLLAEISMVIRGLPELEGVPGLRMRFSPDRLEALYVGVSRKTSQNSSSMREDVRNNKETEIDYINGYIVKRGEQQGIKCVLNYLLMQLIKGKTRSQRNSGQRPQPTTISRVQGEIVPGMLGETPGVNLDDVSSAKRPK